MDTALYYICSTIPQVLAGAIALLGVFWVYKIGILNNKLKGYGRSVIRETSKSPMGDNHRNENYFPETIQRRIESSIEKDDFERIKAIIAYVYECGKFGENNPSLQDFKNYFERDENQKIMLTSTTRTAIIFTSIVIFLSILPIPFATYIESKSSCVIYTIFSVVIFLFALNIFMVSKVVYQALKE